MRIKSKRKDIFQWNRWFAWHPIKIDNEQLWFEFIERKWVEDKNISIDLFGNIFYVGTWEYRNISTKQIKNEES